MRRANPRDGRSHFDPAPSYVEVATPSVRMPVACGVCRMTPRIPKRSENKTLASATDAPATEDVGDGGLGPTNTYAAKAAGTC